MNWGKAEMPKVHQPHERHLACASLRQSTGRMDQTAQCGDGVMAIVRGGSWCCGRRRA